MIKPAPGYVLIDPLPFDSFVAPTKESYEEIGTVLALADQDFYLEVGMKVYFDSWLAAKYPKDTNGNFHWIVPLDSIKAYEEQVS